MRFFWQQVGGPRYRSLARAVMGENQVKSQYETPHPKSKLSTRVLLAQILNQISSFEISQLTET